MPVETEVTTTVKGSDEPDLWIDMISKTTVDEAIMEDLRRFPFGSANRKNITIELEFESLGRPPIRPYLNLFDCTVHENRLDTSAVDITPLPSEKPDVQRFRVEILSDSVTISNTVEIGLHFGLANAWQWIRPPGARGLLRGKIRFAQLLINRLDLTLHGPGVNEYTDQRPRSMIWFKYEGSMYEISRLEGEDGRLPSTEYRAGGSVEGWDVYCFLIPRWDPLLIAILVGVFTIVIGLIVAVIL
ncbi:MAG: hypothetical protein ACE5IJ_09270 [Thermoplasmata archaeon]